MRGCSQRGPQQFSQQSARLFLQHFSSEEESTDRPVTNHELVARDLATMVRGAMLSLALATLGLARSPVRAASEGKVTMEAVAMNVSDNTARTDNPLPYHKV
jgi:hypothetical protein